MSQSKHSQTVHCTKFSQVLSFPPKTKHACSQTGDATLPVGVNECLNGRGIHCDPDQDNLFTEDERMMGNTSQGWKESNGCNEDGFL